MHACSTKVRVALGKHAELPLLTGVPCTMQSSGGGGAGGGRRLRGGPRPALYDRNKFLAANFSFVVSDAADLAAASADPDLPLDWDDILQVGVETAKLFRDMRMKKRRSEAASALRVWPN